ncbi:cobalt transporter CbiM [Fimbriimonas ginsengisoli]|uniref:Cobalt transport protein CbiM n=1 Tax=Fimbriimonas ginsengisoli Gsoil 348 TaxID=661478 RepID=A0A068NP90_FIMGI|nr:cobalt transporter CbiM [Fimbriimonas ginsengisoli]AIE85378.1 cobalt transport protein CbiM [Fimbriimonas ginsengisoli Gsoil 348]
MHIPDAYLSPVTQAATFAVMVPIWIVAAKRTNRELTTKQAPLLSIGAAFCFAIQMFNIPAIGGTTAHALGAGLLAILVGPWAAVLGMTLALTIQALLFGDGGVLSIGANCFDMAFVASFVSYYSYRMLAGRASDGSPWKAVGAGLGAYAGTVAASLCAGTLLGLQPILAHDAVGHAMYCPYGLNVTLPAMLLPHLLIAGPVEAIVTMAALAYLWQTFPELARAGMPPKVGAGIRLARRLGWVLALTPLGLLASGSAWGEWDLAEIKTMVGYAPAGMAARHEAITPLLPDYGFAGASGKPWQIVGYMVSALVGCGLVALFARGILRKPRPSPSPASKPGAPRSSMPAWLRDVNPPLPLSPVAKSPWMERTILKMRSAIAKTVASEVVARMPGFLQLLNPVAKTIGFLSAMVAVSLARTPTALIAVISLSVGLAWASRVPLRELVTRVAGAVAFFGLVLAIPVSLRAVTPGPTAISLLGISFSGPGLVSAAMILLRLFAGIQLSLLWSQTTRWHDLLRSLACLGVPKVVLSTATLTYRYLFVLVETLAEMVEARTARQPGAMNRQQARSYAGTGAAVLFAKSLALTEETHLAMQARSFDGPSRPARPTPWRRRDLVAVATGAGLTAAIVLMGGILHAL